jgi:hypothetical protein
MDDLPVKLVKTKQFNRPERYAMEESVTNSHCSGAVNLSSPTLE